MPRSSRTRRPAVSIPIREYEFASVPDEPPRTAPRADRAPIKPAAAAPRESRNAARIYFGAAPLVGEREALRP